MVLSRWTRCAAALAVTACVLQGAAFAEDAPASCSLTVSAEDAARGLDVVTDATCASGGEGCIDAICRHCRVSDSTEEDVAAFPSCLDYVATDSAGPSDLTGSGNGNDDSDDDDDGSGGSGDSDSDDDGGSGVMGDMPSQLTADATVSGASYGCPFPTSGGDFAAGIQLVGDASCARGGLGCFADVCRFCKFQESPKSAHLLTCESLGYKVRRPLVVPVLPPVNPDTGCPYNVSSGDFAVGVQLVGDPSCGGGGLGCFKDVCRFCKFQETPQSSHWRSCAEFGYPRTPPPPAPTFATVSVDDDGEWTGETACAYAVSKGDFAVGVQLVGDASCAAGGLGCFGTTCRFCQFRATPQSKHMLTCASLGYPRPAQPVAAPQDIGIADPITGCPFPVSGGDFAAGVQLVGDPTCAKGGLGCFKDVCRFCKFRETPQSKNWVPCSDYNYPPVAPPIVQPADINEPAVDYGTGCPFPVSSGDYAAGVQLVGDATCAKGGVGCFKDVCRFCKFQETPQSKNWVPCASLGWPRTVAPIARPVDIVTEDPATECPYPVSKGDFAAGIQLVGDASCVKGGLGCYKNVCRFCKFQDSPQSSHFVPCSDLGYPRNGATFAPVSLDANEETGCPYPVSSGDYDAGVQLVGDASCDKGGVGCFKDTCRFCKFRETPQSSAYLNCEDLGYFFGCDSGALVPAPPVEGPSTKCPFTASPSDLAAGVLLVGDATCDKGGIGCYEKVCRFCQLVPTEKSNQFVTCASLGYDYGLPPLPTMPAPTPAPAPTTTPPPPPTTTAPLPTAAPTLPPCPFAVSPGDYAVGINLVGDPSCAAGGVGCFQNVCRYCKFKDTPQAANWVPCSNYLQPVAAPADIVETAPPTTLPPPPTPPPTTQPPIVAQVCDRPVSQGDQDAGVGLATDYSCLIRGLGCVQGSLCRYCRVFQSEKSNHLEACSVYGGAAPAAPAIEAPAPAAADPNACVARLAVGETQGGVSAYYDASCSPSGGVGCFGGVCRYCQVFASDKSKDFVPCPTQAVPTAPSVAGPVAPDIAPPVAVAFQEYATGFAAAEKSLDRLLEDETFRTTMLGAACVGAVAVLAVVAIGAKRAVSRRSSADPVANAREPSEPQEDARQPTPQPTPTGVLKDEV